MRSGRIITIGILGFLAAAGCQNSSGGGGGNTQAMVHTTPTPVGSTTSTKVKDGAAPLMFHFAAGGNVRVIDATTGKQLAQSAVAPNTSVRVDAAAGITANDKTLARGPLPKDHRYEIWLDRR